MAAQDAQLLLKVGLDLSTFRNQLATLGQAAAGYNLPIKLKFDRKALQAEVRYLKDWLGKKKFNIELNIVGGLTKDQFEKIQGRLDALSKTKAVEIPVSIRSAVTQKDVLSVVAGINKTIKGSPALENAGGKIRIGTSIKPSITQADVREFKKAVTESLGGISVNVKANVQGGKGGMPPGFPDLMEYMRTQGMVGKTASGMEMRMRNEPGGGQLERVLDTFARGVFRMLGMDPATIRAQEAEKRRLPAINWEAIAGSAQRPSIGPSSTGRLLAGAAPLRSIEASRPAAGLLPSITKQSQLNAGLEALRRALSAQSKGVGIQGTAGSIVAMESGFIVSMHKRFAKAAERYLFGVETQVVDLFDAAARQVEVAVDQYMAKIQAQISQKAKQRVSVVDLGVPGQRLLTGGAEPPRRLALPAAGESGGMLGTPTTVTGGGVTPRRGFPSEGRLFTSKQGPATLLPSGYFENVKKYNAALEIARATSAKFTASQIPLIGGLKEVAGEFGFAIKQVLLFGTAYKGLAFVTSLPGQILNAAKSQQQYNNALQTATQDTGTFAKELLYVDNVQRAFGLNLETTRTGFTRLYASMAPTGFDSGSIEKLFTGISAATAALQLTPDKAERVIYAFGQMASKGQIMSEELKGQLGDVLPGALAIFAKAAGMSVKEFSKAMEDGVFVGGKFREVFAKVSDELMTRFGTGAQAAGKSLQGLLNTVGGNFQRTLESFAPLANIAAQAVLTPLGNALRQLSTSAQVAMGEMERVQGQLGTARQDVSSLRAGGANASQIKAAEQNVAALEARYKALNQAAKDPAVAMQAKNIQLFTQELAKAGNVIMNVARMVGSVLNPFLAFLGTNLSTVVTLLISFAAGFAAARIAITVAMGALTLLNVALKSLAGGVIGVNALSAAFRALGVSLTAAQIGTVGLSAAMKVLLISSGLGIAVGLLTAIAGAALSMGGAMRQAAQDAKQAMQDMAQAAIVGNTALIQMRAATYKANIATLQSMKKEITQGGGRKIGRGGRTATVYDVSPVQRQLLEAVPGVDLPSGPVTTKQFNKAINDAQYMQQVGLKAATKFQQISKANETNLGLNKPMPGPAAPEAPSGGGTKEKAKGKDDAKRLAEEIARQAMAASDALFSERQRLLIMQQTNPIAKAFAQYTSQELTIQRELNQALKEAKGDKEKADLRETARLKQSANALELEQEMKRAREDALAPIEDLIKGQREQLRYEEDVKNLLQQGMLPERAKQVAEVRKIVRAQLESLDLSIKNARAAITEAEARGASADQMERLKKALEDLEKSRGAMEGKGKEAEAGVPTPPTEAKSPLDYIKESAANAQTELAKLTNWGYQVAEAGKAIGSAFGTAFKDVISGSASAQEALASMMQSIADHFLDMAAQIIAQQITMMIYGIILKALGVMGGAAGGGGASSNAAGFGGSFDAGIAPLPGIPDYSGAFKFANGGIASGGFVPFKAFASGGMVAGPTLGLVGEGKYNEAIVPLPDGRSIPVQLQDSSIRDKMGDSMSSMGGMPMLSMNFQSTTINGVEYVDRAQLEAAMAETRKISVREGATRGATIALDKLANSPSSRRRVGLR